MMKHLAFTAGLVWLAMVGNAIGSPVVIPNVPAYDWYHGCGPTAVASIMGYYDLNGYDNLFTASGWDQVKLTINVQDQISSPEHNAKYDPTPDDPNLPIPPKTSIADWYKTSMDPMGYGWSYLHNAPGPNGAFEGYATYRGYDCTTTVKSILSDTLEARWLDLTAEIDAGRPPMFLVDNNGDGDVDHSIPVIGYEDCGINGKWYACYTTWSENESWHWYQFRQMDDSYGWGIHSMIFVQFSPVPEPSTFLLLGTAAVGWWVFAWRKHNR